MAAETIVTEGPRNHPHEIGGPSPRERITLPCSPTVTKNWSECLSLGRAACYRVAGFDCPNGWLSHGGGKGARELNAPVLFEPHRWNRSQGLRLLLIGGTGNSRRRAANRSPMWRASPATPQAGAQRFPATPFQLSGRGSS
jgi:hypothetical protein